MEQFSTADLEAADSIISALDSRLRVLIILKLAKRDHFVHELVSSLEKSQPLISQHLRVLKMSGLVDATRAGREVVYSLAEPAIIDIIFQLADLAVVHCAGEGNDELASRRRSDATTIRDQRSSSNAAAIIDPPSDIRPQRDPGLAPFTPGPTRE